MAVFSTLRLTTLRPRLLLAAALLLCALGAVVGAPAALSAHSKRQPKAHAAASFQAGIADEGTEMFSDELWRQLHTHVTRYIAPYDTAVRGYSQIGRTSCRVRV